MNLIGKNEGKEMSDFKFIGIYQVVFTKKMKRAIE